MILASENLSVVLINPTVKPHGHLVAGIAYMEPTQEPYTIVSDRLKQHVYKVFSPPELATARTYLVGPNIDLKFEKV